MKKVLAAVVIIVLVAVAGGVFLLNRDEANNTPETTATDTVNERVDTNTEEHQMTDADNPIDEEASTTNTVTIDNFNFSPARITVKRGTTVTWTNRDSAAHTVTMTEDGDGPDSDELSTGDTYSFTFDTVGTFQYHCSLHPQMTGTVTVTE